MQDINNEVEVEYSAILLTYNQYNFQRSPAIFFLHEALIISCNTVSGDTVVAKPKKKSGRGIEVQKKGGGCVSNKQQRVGV